MRYEGETVSCVEDGEVRAVVSGRRVNAGTMTEFGLIQACLCEVGRPDLVASMSGATIVTGSLPWKVDIRWRVEPTPAELAVVRRAVAVAMMRDVPMEGVEPSRR